ncbi:MAG: cysteine protease StiP family protein [Campylobacterota bacterium]|nr:cysteine protease StiP family protein [Campylobacterota bacterium]
MEYFSGSYESSDVRFLVTLIEPEVTDIKTKEANIRAGMHYSQMISPEYEPSQEYIDVFYKALRLNKSRVALDVLRLSHQIVRKAKPILISLLRAGTPIGVLLKRTLKHHFDCNAPHYSISIIRDLGIDENALNHIVAKHPDSELIFIDGWTGKGVIKRELDSFIAHYNQTYNQNLSSELYVLSDIAGVADFSGGYDDYLIPSSALNSTVSGLVSRSILNDRYITPEQFHGVKFYKEYQQSDFSRFYIDTIMQEISNIDTLQPLPVYKQNEQIAKQMQKYIATLQKRFSITNINYIKPGIGETTRVLLRRDPYKILVRDSSDIYITHIIKLAHEKGIEIIEEPTLPYSTVGIIKDRE